MIILSAALDLVGPNVPKGVVLLADVIPSFLTKLCAPYFIHAIPYHARIFVFVTLSACGMLLIALTPGYTDGSTITAKMAGVILASLSSGGGELSFLGLTHYYGPLSLAAWGSGTGGAGLIGAGMYALATTTMGFSVKATILASACLPAVMLVSFFIILPQEALRHGRSARMDDLSAEIPVRESEGDEDGLQGVREDEGLLGTTDMHAKPVKAGSGAGWDSFKANLKRSRRLFVPLSVALPYVLLTLLTC